MNEPYFAQKDGTQQQPPAYFPPPGSNKPRPAGKKPNMTWLKYGGAALAGLLIGVVIGMSGQGPLAEELEQVKADSQESLVAAKEDAQDKTDALEDQLAGKDAEIDEAEFRAQKAEDRVDDRLAGLEEIESEP
ncbi:MAG: hypothetical protein H0U17_02750 [Actinobacteria bacterium]|nr:hypothetical protein [Actinomycetota bacterium]